MQFRKYWLAAALSLCLPFAEPLSAQSDTSQIIGNVRDASGSSAPNARVIATNEGTGIERQATTNADGYFIVTNMPPGYYTVTVELTGFKKVVRRQNKLDAAIPLSMDIVLDVGAVTESVEVVASAARLKRRRSPTWRSTAATRYCSLS